LNYYYAGDAGGLLPAIWLSSAVCTSGTGGTLASPYSLEACPPSQIGDTTATGKVVTLPIAHTPVNWLVTANQEDNYTMLVSLENVCKISAVGCVTYTGASGVGSGDNDSGTVWNSDAYGAINCTPGDTTGSCNKITTSPKTYNYLQQMDNIYTHLPVTIGGLPKDATVQNKLWDMDGFSPGNPVTRVNNYDLPITKRVNLVSAYEWQEGLDSGDPAPTTLFYWDEPLVNSVGDLWCRAQYGTPGTDANGGIDNNCLDQNIYSGFNLLWLRSAYNNPTYPNSGEECWHIQGEQSASLFSNYTFADFGLLPALWFPSSLSLGSGTGTKTDPYVIPYGYPAALVVAETSGNENSGISLSGTAKGSEDNQNIAVWADACNTAGQCLRKEFANFDPATSGTAQQWTLTWLPRELPAGTYSGTLWVGLATSVDGTIIDTLSAQSESVNFTLAATIRTFPVTALKDQPFSLDLGLLTNYDLASLSLPTTDHGVTATSTASHLILSSLSGLAAPTTATFGNTAFTFALQELASGIIEVSFE
jgi:hypothetical protein